MPAVVADWDLRPSSYTQEGKILRARSYALQIVASTAKLACMRRRMPLWMKTDLQVVADTARLACMRVAKVYNRNVRSRPFASGLPIHETDLGRSSRTVGHGLRSRSLAVFQIALQHAICSLPGRRRSEGLDDKAWREGWPTDRCLPWMFNTRSAPSGQPGNGSFYICLFMRPSVRTVCSPPSLAALCLPLTFFW